MAITKTLLTQKQLQCRQDCQIPSQLAFLTAFFGLTVLVFQLLVVSAYAEIDCPINSGPCVKQIPLDKVQVTFDINPKPVKFMEDLHFKITLTQEGKPITNAKISMELGMPGMFMGKNTPVLKHLKEGVYEGKGIIPRCPSGKRLWRAIISIERDNKTAQVDFTFEGK